MRKMVKVAAVVAILVSLTLGQTMLMAAPVQGARASDRSAHVSIYQNFLSVLKAIWGGSNRPVTYSPSSKCAVWGGGC